MLAITQLILFESSKKENLALFYLSNDEFFVPKLDWIRSIGVVIVS